MTGQVPRMNDYEDVGGHFFIDENCQRPDELLDDQTLLMKSNKGLIVVFGCAHSGVVNTLDYISKLTGEKKHIRYHRRYALVRCKSDPNYKYNRGF